MPVKVLLLMRHGLTIHHTGDANDYVGKGLSGGTVIVTPNEKREQEIIAGNVSFMEHQEEKLI